MLQRLNLLLIAVIVPASAMAQGEDSSTWERDLQVIAQLLEGGFDNANQAYFDYRTGNDVKHARIHAEIERLDRQEAGDFVFRATFESKGGAETSARRHVWSLAADRDRQAVVMTVENSSCELIWRREAAQFTASAESCEDDGLTALVLSDRQLWATIAGRT